MQARLLKNRGKMSLPRRLRKSLKSVPLGLRLISNTDKSNTDKSNMDKPKAAYLEGSDVEAVARMLNALLTEHWILRDRLAVLERILEAILGDRGILENGEIDAYVPSEDMAEALETLRNTVFGNVIGAPFAPGDATVAELRERRP